VKNPFSNGEACPTSLMETRGCNKEPCHKVDCKVSDWNNWGACTSTCGPGHRQRARSILQHPTDGGMGCGLDLSQLAECPNEPCGFVDCKWGGWSDWTLCDAQCDGGQRSRKRQIVQRPGEGGKPCEPLSKEEVTECNLQACTPEVCIDGAWGAWTDWEACSKSCKGGTTWRMRNMDAEANHCGSPATGPSRVSASCNNLVPCEDDIDCVFADWSSWTACSSQCNGIKRRSRGIFVHGSGAGMFCMGPLNETVPCNPGPGGTAPAVCGGAAAVDCKMSTWSDWGTCSASCGRGSHRRDRRLLQEPANGGRMCEERLGEVRGCSSASCSSSCQQRDCVWKDWGDWSACDKCGGQRKRFRHVMQEPRCGGTLCDANNAEETTNCTRMCHEPMYCKWGDWHQWSACSTTCGKALKSRMRQLSLTNEKPLRFLEEYDAASDPSGTQLKQKIQNVRQQTRELQSRRTQEYVAAFACGGFSLIVGFAVVRVASRSARDIAVRMTFSQVPS